MGRADGRPVRERTTTTMTKNRITPEDPPSTLLEIDDKQFESLVDLDVKGKLGPEIAAKFKDPRVAARWYNTLVGMKRTAEGVIHARRVEARSTRRELIMRAGQVQQEGECNRLLREAEKLQLDFEKWQVNTIRFLTSLEERLTYARYYRAPHGQADLIAAIQAHAAAIDPEDATEYDVTLWKTAGIDAPVGV